MAIKKILEIIRGDTPSFKIQVVEEDDTGVQTGKDLTGNDATLCLPGESSDVKLTSSPAAGLVWDDITKGILTATLTAEQSNALKKGDSQSFYLILVSGSVERTVKFRNQLTVDDRDFK